ncbi:MAG: nitroreductase family protein [Clostridia bacterium]
MDPELPGPDPDTIKELVSLAILAPNHKFTFPWRFHVVTGDDRKELGRLWAEESRENDWVPESALAREAAKLERGPVLIFVGMVSETENAVRYQEDLLATGAAVENLLLLFHDRGFSTMWRTGRMVVSKKIKAAIGYQEGEETVAVLYVGQMSTTFNPPPRRRPPVEDVISFGLTHSS